MRTTKAIPNNARVCDQPTFLHGYLQGLKAQLCKRKRRTQSQCLCSRPAPLMGQPSAQRSGKLKTRQPGSKTSGRPHQPLPKQQTRQSDFAASRQGLAKKAASQVRKLGPLKRDGHTSRKAPLPEPFTAAAARVLAGVEAQPQKQGRGRGAKQSVIHALLQAYRTSFTAALEAEFAEEWQLAEERLNSWPAQRLQEEGVAVFGLTAVPDGMLFKDNIIRFWGPSGRGLPHHVLAAGDIVLISKSAPGDEAVEGVVMDYSSRWVRVAVPQSVAGLLQDGPWRLDQYGNTTAHERCVAAVQSFTDPKTSASPAESHDLWRLLLGIIPGQVGGLRAGAEQAPAWTKGSSGQGRLQAALASLKAATNTPGGLNSSQAAAVKAGLTQTLTLWQGPPGTGKSTTLLHFIRIAVGLLPQGDQLLATAASNVAVDGLVMGLMKQGVRVVRIGQPAKVSEGATRVTLEALMADHPAGKAAAKLHAGQGRVKGPHEKAALRQRIMALEAQAAEEILGGAQVVAATCVGAGDPRLGGCRFRLCALDEASQATEPAALIPLLSQCQAAVLVGDPCQLPPTVVSPRAGQAGMGVSLMERLQRCGLAARLLQVQYRMHPLLAAWPSAAFYKGRLQSHPTPADRQPPPGFPWPQSQPLAFMECQGQEERVSSGTTTSTGTSYFNSQEAQAVASTVQKLLAGSTQPGDIGVITPYSGQVREVRSALEQRLMPVELSKLDVKTVDGYQGQEKEVIVFSAVRSNPGGLVGFLADARRLNVAMTRARRGLIVIGCSKTLRHDPTWRSWLRWVQQANLEIVP